MRVLIIYFAEYLNSFRVGFRAKGEQCEDGDQPTKPRY